MSTLSRVLVGFACRAARSKHSGSLRAVLCGRVIDRVLRSPLFTRPSDGVRQSSHDGLRSAGGLYWPAMSCERVLATSGHEGCDDIAGVAVEVVAGPVVAGGGPGIRVTGCDLYVAQRHAGI